MAEQDEGALWRLVVGVSLIALVGLSGILWFVLDQYGPGGGRFTAYPLIVAGAGFVGGIWLIYGKRAQTAGMVFGGVLATVAAIYPVIVPPAGPAGPARPADEQLVPGSVTTTAPGPVPGTDGVPTTATATTGPVCSGLGQAGTVAAAPGVGRQQVTDLTYEIDGATASIEMAGRLVGDPGPSEGEGLHVAVAGTSNDALAGYSLLPEVEVGADGCWHLPPSPLGDPCAGAAFSFALVPDAEAAALTAEQEGSGGAGLAPSRILDNPEVRILGSLSVQRGC